MHTGELKRSNKVLRSYSNHKVKPVVQVTFPRNTKTKKQMQNWKLWTLFKKTCLANALGLTVWLNSLPEGANGNKVSTNAKATVNLNTHTPVGLEDFPELAHTTHTLPGKYSIKIDPDAKGIVYPLRRQLLLHSGTGVVKTPEGNDVLITS